jgi:hypothetical protein
MRVQISLTRMAMLLSLAATAITVTLSDPAAVHAQTINKPSIQVTLQVHKGYKGDPETWSWTPTINFRVNGPVTVGSHLSVEYSLPTNKSWLKFDCGTGEAGPYSWVGVQNCGQNPPDEQAVTYIGPVDFRINLKNELEGKGLTLLAGKFTVERFHEGTVDLPKFKNNFVYYVNYDWNLPIAYVFGEDVSYVEKPSYKMVPASLNGSRLMVAFWFKGQDKALIYGKFGAYLYYQGRLVAETVTEGTSCEVIDRPESNVDSPNGYCARMFNIKAMVWDKNPEYRPADFFPMHKNPGEYEIKVLQDGKLARTAKFTMGSNYQIVDTGIGKQNTLGTWRTVVPALIVGDQDGQWDRNAYKTAAFFGNPMSGFIAP